VDIRAEDVTLLEALDMLARATGSFAWRMDGGVVNIITKSCAEAQHYPLNEVLKTVGFSGTMDRLTGTLWRISREIVSHMPRPFPPRVEGAERPVFSGDVQVALAMENTTPRDLLNQVVARVQGYWVSMWYAHRRVLRIHFYGYYELTDREITQKGKDVEMKKDRAAELHVGRHTPPRFSPWATVADGLTMQPNP
jgi:hypothetical protein